MQINNYVKLYVRAPGMTLHDGETVRGSTWLFPFGGSGKAALKAAQEKRVTVRDLFPDIPAEAFQLSTFAPSGLRGVPVVGEPIRALSVVEAA